MFHRSVWICLFLVSWLAVVPTNAQDGRVVKLEGGYFATLPDYPDQKFALKSLGGKAPSLEATSENVPNSHAHIRLISYFAGQTGTDRLVEHYRALVLEAKTGRLLGDVPQSYIVSTTPRASQPFWTWKKNQLLVDDGEFGRQVRVTLP